MNKLSIQTTDNPRVIKFVANKVFLEGSLELDKNSDVSHIPLAKELFSFPFVTRLFITANFIAIAKDDSIEWDTIAMSLRDIIIKNLEKSPKIILKKENKPIFFSEQTPNPEVMKFVSEKPIINGFLELKSSQEAQEIPLAKGLFQFDFVKEIFINDNYIAITKHENTNWDNILDKIQNYLQDFFLNKQKAEKISGIFEKYQAQSFNNRGFTEIEEKINAILQEYVAPAVENDGGKISLIEFDEETKTAKMLLQGACSGCPSSTITLKNGIENLLKNFLPNIVENVEAING